MKPLPAIVRPVLRQAASMLSGSGANRKLLVLMYHRVLAEPDTLNVDEPDRAEFAAQMDLVSELFNVMTIAEATSRIRSASLPPRSLCITFDDGYRNNREVAAPVLASRGLRATFFVSTGYLNGGRMWNDTVTEAVRRAPAEFDLTDIGLGRHALPDVSARARLVGQLLKRLKYLGSAPRQEAADAIASRAGASLPDDLMMTERQVAELAGMGMEVGAHSVSHPILSTVDAEAARREIVESKHALESIVGGATRSFAYPNGQPGRDYAAEHALMVRDAGFDSAVSTAWGCYAARMDRYQIPRLSPWDKTSMSYAARLLRVYTEPGPKIV